MMSAKNPLRSSWQCVSLVAIVGLSMACDLAAAPPAAKKTVFVKSAVGKSTTSYEHATELAVRNAVRAGAGVWIHSESKVKDFELLRDIIYTRIRGYVTKYDVLRKHRKDNLYVVELSAHVGLGKLRGDWNVLQSLIVLVGRPDFVVEVEAPKNANADEVITWISGKLNSRLEKLGLTAIYQPVKKEGSLRDYIKAINQKDMARARSMKTKLGAPYGIYVKAFGDVRAVDIFDVEFQNATMTLQGTVASRSTAATVASETGEGVATELAETKAIMKACQSAADGLFDACVERIVQHWSRQIDKGVKVEVEATKLKYAELSQLKKHLAGIDKVESVRIVESDPEGISVLDIFGLINAETVANAIGKFGGSALEPQILGPQRVACKKAPKDKKE